MGLICLNVLGASIFPLKSNLLKSADFVVHGIARPNRKREPWLAKDHSLAVVLLSLRHAAGKVHVLKHGRSQILRLAKLRSKSQFSMSVSLMHRQNLRTGRTLLMVAVQAGILQKKSQQHVRCVEIDRFSQLDCESKRVPALHVLAKFQMRL